ncbi:MAG: hypothetical protein ACI8ZX_001939 [Planctomycetota bacterium]|jgi:hypothetical protein
MIHYVIFYDYLTFRFLKCEENKKKRYFFYPAPITEDKAFI